jgi:hypothetical protein
VSRIDNNISYTAPNSNGIFGFRINNRYFDIAVGQVQITKPIIKSPITSTSNLGPDVTFITTSFLPIGGTDIHLSTVWQISETVNFNVVLIDSGYDTVNKTVWTVKNLSKNKNFFIRVKHVGQTSGESQWSDIIQFKTKDMYIPTNEVQKVTAESSIGYNSSDGEAYGSWVRISGNGQVMIVGTDNHDLNVALGQYKKGNDYCDIFIKNNSTWDHTQRIFETNSNNGIRASLNFDGSIIALGTHKYYGSEGSQLNLGYNTPVSPLANADGLSTARIYIKTVNAPNWTIDKIINLDNGYVQTPLMTYPVISSDGTVLVIGKSYQGPKLDTWLTANSDPVTHSWVKPTTTPNAEVLVYRKSLNDWVLNQTLAIPNSLENSERVGISRDNNTILVYDQVDLTVLNNAYPSPYTGSLHVFKDNGTGQFISFQTIRNSDAKYKEYYGMICDQVMSSNGSVIAVGSFGRRNLLSTDDITQSSLHNLTPVNGFGYVDIWKLVGGQYVKTYRLTPSVTQQFSHFGKSIWLSPDGDTVVVGSEYDSSEGTNAGLVYIFKENSVTGKWLEISKIFPTTSVGNNEKFGTELSVSDNMHVMAIGAWADDPSRSKNTVLQVSQDRAGFGAVYLFE